MVVIHTRVLNGLPVRVEADVSTGFDGEVIVEEMTVYWNKKPNKLGQYYQAKVIEDKMQPDDWKRVEEEIIEALCYHQSGWYVN